MSKDFEDYGYDKKICKIYSGQPVFPADVTITTWQSFSKAPKEVIQSFDMVVGDEAHLFKANYTQRYIGEDENHFNKIWNYRNT